MARPRLPRLGFVGTFALLSATAVGLLGIALAQVETAHERSSATSDAASSAQLLVQVGLQPHIDRSDLTTGLPPETIAALDSAFQAGSTTDSSSASSSGLLTARSCTPTSTS